MSGCRGVRMNYVFHRKTFEGVPKSLLGRLYLMRLQDLRYQRDAYD